MSVMQIKDNIFWVGVMDPELEVFDIIMKTEYGTSYNSYLVRGEEKIALIDSVKEEFFEEYLARLKQLVDLEQIDYLIVNHTEPDHAGSIEKLLNLIPGLTIVGHANAVEFLREVCNCDFPYQMIRNRSEIDLGGKTLHFINALLLHWPDTMYTYVKEDKVLFSCDSFGSHYPDERLFNDLINKDLTEELRDYFEHILGPFKIPMQRALDRLERYDIDIICPGHGPVLRQNLDYYINLYREWSKETTAADTRPTVILAWISAHGYTEKLATSIEQGLNTDGALNVKVYDMLTADPNELAREMENAAGVLIGSPTINKCHADYPGLKILNAILGGYFGSRLMKNIREEKGYTYGITSSVTSLKMSGYKIISAEVNKKYAQATIDEIFKEIRTLQKKPVGKEELKIVKNYMLGEMVRMFDGMFALAYSFRSVWDFDLDNSYFYRFTEKIKSIKAEEIISLADTYYNIDDLYVITAG